MAASSGAMWPPSHRCPTRRDEHDTLFVCFLVALLFLFPFSEEMGKKVESARGKIGYFPDLDMMNKGLYSCKEGRKMAFLAGLFLSLGMAQLFFGKWLFFVCVLRGSGLEVTFWELVD